MKNRRNIVELKYPPENPNDIWLKDGKFYRSTSEGWIVIDSKTEYISKESMIVDNPKGGTIGIDKETGETSIYNDVAEQWSPLSGGGVTSITWLELKDKRDAGKLIPGSLYRITDYNCTTTQKNTKSAGHQFDIVLLALSENKLAEEGWAMMHDNIYDVTFADGVTLKCYISFDNNGNYIVVNKNTLLGEAHVPEEDLYDVDEVNKTAKSYFDSIDLIRPNYPYNYFQNSNLSAWKVWYCLDNDTDRFAWANGLVSPNDNVTPIPAIQSGGSDIYKRLEDFDDEYNGVKYYAWQKPPYNGYNDVIFTKSPTPKVGDRDYDENFDENSRVSNYIPAGRGVIYRLIDEFNNDIKYDFKNIQFKRKLTNGQYDKNGTETWCYTLNIWYNDMCQDASIVGNTLPNDEGFVNGVYDNNFGYATAYNLYIEGVNTFAFALGDNVVLSFDDGSYYGIKSNIIGNSFNSNTIGNGFNSNTIGNYFYSNTIGDFFESNTIGSGFSANIIGNSFNGNTIGNYVSDNTIRDSFNANTIGNNFNNKTISDNTSYKNYGNNGVELATKNDIGDIETALSNI